MRKLQDERGYMLLLTIGLIILFSVLGLSLMTLTSSGVANNANRQDNVQSLNLAEKAEQYFVQDFNTSIQSILDLNNGVDREEFVKILDDLTNLNKITASTSYLTNFDISKYKCEFDVNNKVSSGLNVYTSNTNDKSYACIKSAEPVYNEDGTINDLKKKVVIVNIGVANGKLSQFETTMEVGSDYVPQQLYYAITSKLGGDIHLNGAVEIAGDLRVGNALTINDYAYFVKGGNYWGKTLLPTIRATDLTKRPRIVMEDPSEIFKLNQTNSDSTTNKNAYENMSPDYKDNQQTNTRLQNMNIDNLLDYSVYSTKPSVISTTDKVESLPISETIKTSKFNHNGSKVITVNEGLVTTQNLDDTQRGYLQTQKETCFFWSCTITNSYTGNFQFNNWNYTIGKLGTAGSVTISNSTLNISDYFYIEGDLNLKGNVEIQGTLYVNGNVDISNANVKSNAMIYTNGSFTVKDSTLNSLTYRDSNNKTQNGTVIVFATGEVNISNISQFKETPSTIYGYFYSEKQLEIYGVGSNINIYGGLFGEKIILNAVRGNTLENTTTSNHTKYDNENSRNYLAIRNITATSNYITTTFSNNLSCNTIKQTTDTKCYNSNSQSRLKVYYDQNVIQTFKELNSVTQIITKINKPTYLEKNIIN